MVAVIVVVIVVVLLVVGVVEVQTKADKFEDKNYKTKRFLFHLLNFYVKQLPTDCKPT